MTISELETENAKLRAELASEKARFTVDVNIVKAFDELIEIGKQHTVPQPILRDWQVKWLNAHLRFHNKKEDELRKDLSEALAALDVAKSLGFIREYDPIISPVIAVRAEMLRLKDKVIEYSEALESLDAYCSPEVRDAVLKCWREALAALKAAT